MLVCHVLSWLRTSKLSFVAVADGGTGMTGFEFQKNLRQCWRCNASTCLAVPFHMRVATRLKGLTGWKLAPMCQV